MYHFSMTNQAKEQQGLMLNDILQENPKHNESPIRRESLESMQTRMSRVQISYISEPNQKILIFLSCHKTLH